MEVISRDEARNRGLKRYYTGVLCKHRHDSERFVSDGRCLKCCAEKMRRYWANNPKATEKRNKHFRDRYADPEYRAAELEKRRIKWAEDRGWRNQQKAEMRKRHLARYANPEYAEKVREQSREYAKNNRGIMNARIARRRAALEQRTPAWADQDALRDIYKSCPEGLEVDHVVPLRGKKVSGLHVPHNLQYLTPEENRAKANRYRI